jgi:hypothetical protein
MKRMEEQGIISGMDAKWMKMVQEQGINSGWKEPGKNGMISKWKLGWKSKPKPMKSLCKGGRKMDEVCMKKVEKQGMKSGWKIKGLKSGKFWY